MHINRVKKLCVIITIMAVFMGVYWECSYDDIGLLYAASNLDKNISVYYSDMQSVEEKACTSKMLGNKSSVCSHAKSEEVTLLKRNSGIINYFLFLSFYSFDNSINMSFLECCAGYEYRAELITDYIYKSDGKKRI